MSLDILDFEEGDVSTMDIAQNLNALLEKHRRGPGDEEDYESPPRPERVVKRGRLEEQSEEKNESHKDRQPRTQGTRQDGGNGSGSEPSSQ